MTIRKPKLYLKLVVGVKAIGTSEGYNDSKKKTKKSKTSYLAVKKMGKADLLYVFFDSLS